MCKRLLWVAMLIIHAGCASTYTPSGRMLQLKQNMDKQSAVTIFTKYTKSPTGGNGYYASGGYCGGNVIKFDKGTPMTITPDGYSLQAYKAGDLIGTERTGNTIKRTYKKVYYQENRGFKEIIKIRVVQGNFHLGYCHNENKTGYSLNLYFSTADFDAIGVTETDLDELLAALSTLAPQAKFIQGVGL